MYKYDTDIINYTSKSLQRIMQVDLLILAILYANFYFFQN